MNIEKIDDLRKKLWNVKLCAVTKYQSDHVTTDIVSYWIKIIGESKVHDAKRKYLLLEDMNLSCSIHMIGHLQSNKVKDAVWIFDVIQSVDSEKLIRKINDSIEFTEVKSFQEIYLQLNLSWETQKYGFWEQDILQMIALCDSLPNIRCTWLMCMWMLWDQEKTKQMYRICKLLCNRYALENCSMWMSWDRQLAIQEWATIVRLWSILFNY